MVYFEEQKTEVTKMMQMEEALKRMEQLQLMEQVVTEFKENGQLCKSKGGILYLLSKEEGEMIKKWEEEHHAVVYHVIIDRFDFGICYSLLYVSEYMDEWEMDKEWLAKGYPIVYVMNIDDDSCSEFGSIGIQCMFGAIVRTD